MANKRFGHLTVLFEKSPSQWHCKCDCGKEKWIYAPRLTSGQTTYCGYKCPAQRLDNFQSKIKKIKSGCWEWAGYRKPSGYGEFAFDGHKSIGAHVASYRLFIGEIPPASFVLHRCDNKPCVNPSHLFLGSQALNMTDKTNKGRQAFGIAHGMAKLSAEQAAEIRAKFSQGARKAPLAREYGISKTHVHRIILNKSRIFG